MDLNQPQLFIDFVLVGEELYLRFANSSDAEAYRVSVTFSEPILAFNSTKDLTRINLFKRLSFFAPRKEFVLYIDEISRFLATLKTSTIRTTIQYQNTDKKSFKKEISHDLTIYQDLPIIIKP